MEEYLAAVEIGNINLIFREKYDSSIMACVETDILNAKITNTETAKIATLSLIVRVIRPLVSKLVISMLIKQ